ncbi:MAG: hypothetical protein R3D05_20530 [Dongiaceae bacterium]
MNARLKLWVGVSAYALLGSMALPSFTLAGDIGAPTGSSQDNDLDPNGGFQHECGEPGGCAEAGETIESRSADEFGEEREGRPSLVTPTQPRSGHSGLGAGDSVRGGVHDGGLGGGRGLGD